MLAKQQIQFRIYWFSYHTKLERQIGLNGHSSSRLCVADEAKRSFMMSSHGFYYFSDLVFIHKGL